MIQLVFEFVTDVAVGFFHNTLNNRDVVFVWPAISRITRALQVICGGSVLVFSSHPILSLFADSA